MTASGLVAADSCTEDNQHVFSVVQFALAIKSQLQVVNVHSFNNFQLRIGASLAGPELFLRGAKLLNRKLT